MLADLARARGEAAPARARVEAVKQWADAVDAHRITDRATAFLADGDH
ncbi:hypothetical protein V5P93_005152 [Actinokineospora auranticolor]|nr:hypothetical protein [Actinokineospora auranticolor]